MATWNDVQVGDWVRGKDNALWAVKDRMENPRGTVSFVMGRKGKADFIATVGLHQETPEIVRTGQEMQDSAIKAVTETLGGVVLQVETPGQPFACPPTFAEPGSMITHLFLLHGKPISEGNVTLAALNALHDALHKSRGDGYQHHQHTPDYLARNR